MQQFNVLSCIIEVRRFCCVFLCFRAHFGNLNIMLFTVRKSGNISHQGSFWYKRWIVSKSKQKMRSSIFLVPEAKVFLFFLNILIYYSNDSSS